MSDKYNFELTMNPNASPGNQQPDLRGEYRLAGRAATQIAFWSHKSEAGNLFLSGNLTPSSVAATLRAGHAPPDQGQAAPPNINLNVNQAILFENREATAENKKPHFYGWAREADSSYVRLSGWDRGHGVVGTAEPFRPSGGGNDGLSGHEVA
jgi:hypothetical protein